MQKHLKITINGKHYSITTDEDDADIVTAAGLVDSLLKQKAEKKPVGNQDHAAIIVALELATDLAKQQRLFQMYEHKMEQLVTLLNQAA